jgi:hypothetical protein
MYNHAQNMRIAKTFTMDESVLAAVERTKGKRSMSERVNELLKLALEQEQRKTLEQEAARFYSVANQSNRTEERAFRQASFRRMRRD